MSHDPQTDFVDFFEHGVMALHSVGPDGTILRANRAELELLGYTPEEYIGKNIARFHVDPETIADILRRLSAGERIQNYPARLRCKDGSIRHVVIDSSVRFQGTEFLHTRCFTRDVTAEIEARQAAEKAHGRLAWLAGVTSAFTASLDYDRTLNGLARALVPEIADWCGIHIVEADGAIRLAAMAHIDPARETFAREWLGRHPIAPEARYGVPAVIRSGETLYRPQVTGEMIERAARTPEEREALRSLAIASAIIVPLTARGRTLGTITVFMAESGRLYETHDVALIEELAGRAALAIDNARLFAREREARAAAEEANRLKDDFVAVLSHELRTPLTSAYGWVRLLQMRQLTPPEREKALDVIGRSVDMQLKVINDLLDISAVAAGKVQLERQIIDLAELVAREVEVFNGLVAGTLDVVSVLDGPVWVDVDPLRMRQVVSNLLTNAHKFTPAGGRVEIRVGQRDDTAYTIVSDTGQGIAPEFLPHVFDRFRQAEPSTTRRVGGLGLGLAIVRSFVTLHGGTVVAESDGAGKGARFTVTLPSVDR